MLSAPTPLPLGWFCICGFCRRFMKHDVYCHCRHCGRSAPSMGLQRYLIPLIEMEGVTDE